ncbi:molybdopterin-dependent oxidoreductase [Slackia heliotrinireducens]|uniref:molybdopterin-dependent oxidoreductase n=1 Tax=Slackia heliotrinireducens TaxID=84110 RepID=UPI00331460D8
MTKNLTRRNFVAAAGAAAAALAAVGCSPETKVEETDAAGEQSSEQPEAPIRDAELNPNAAGEWKPVQCWTSCGGKCLLQAYVEDGIIGRIKTDDIYEDTLETFQNRGCPRGRSMRSMHAGTERMKYPMKRKHWQPGGGDNVNGDLRGVDEWERISWDEAYDLIAQEMKRIYEEYGPRSVLHTTFPRTTMRSMLLNPMGGCTVFDMCDSYGTYHHYAGNMGHAFNGGEPGRNANNDRLDLLKSEYIVMEGGNPAWCSGGTPMLHFKRAKDAGAQFVYIGPDYNATASLMDAKWIHILPGSDTAFLLAVAYEMLRLDEEQGGIIDWDFLDKYSVGFDADHMPEDMTVDENIKDYILGKYDDTPKTPEWAAPLCGAEPEDMTWLAEVLGKDHAVAWIWGYTASRCFGAENLPQIQETIACMGGHHGKPGHSAGAQYHFFSGNDGADLVEFGDAYPEGHAPELPASTVDDNILENQEFSAITTGEYDWFGAVVDYSNGKSAVVPSERRTIDIRMIVADFGNPLVVRCNTNEGIKAFRKVDFVLTQALVFTPTAQYSDIVLPVATSWEDENGDDYHLNQQNRETLMWQQFGVVAAPYECKTDREMNMEIGRRLGLDIDALYPYTGKEMHLYRLINATVTADDGVTKEKLLTLTQEDIDKYGIRDVEPQEGRVTLDEMMRTGIYHVPRKEGDNLGWIGYKDFIDDPEGHPLGTNSGKFELYCQPKAQIYEDLGWQREDNKVKPYANYLVPEFFGAAETDPVEAKKTYPIQLFNGHYLRRSHSAFDASGYMREAFASPVFMSRADAEERGIQTGDWVRLFNDAGEVVRQASIMDTMMPGVANHMHGSWFELDEDGVSINGGTNMLTDSRTPCGTQQGFNTTLVQIEKYTKQDIQPDAERAVIMPDGIEE